MNYEKEKLHFASGDGELEEVKALVAKGYDINHFDEDLDQTQEADNARVVDANARATVILERTQRPLP